MNAAMNTATNTAMSTGHRNDASAIDVAVVDRPSMTRRTVLGSGMIAASIACSVGSAASAEVIGYHAAPRPIDALLVDHGVEMPRLLATFVAARARTLPIVGIRLDAVGHAALVRVLRDSHVLAGITSGATLFCVERIAWDHGYRLTARSGRCSADLDGADLDDADLDDGACLQEAVAFLNAAHPSGRSLSVPARHYRPSRQDGTLHAWTMQKSSSAPSRLDRMKA